MSYTYEEIQQMRERAAEDRRKHQTRVVKITKTGLVFAIDSREEDKWRAKLVSMGIDHVVEDR